MPSDVLSARSSEREAFFIGWSKRNKKHYADLIEKNARLLRLLVGAPTPDRYPTAEQRLSGHNWLDETPKPCSPASFKHWQKVLSAIDDPRRAPPTGTGRSNASLQGGGARRGLSNIPYSPVAAVQTLELHIRPASAKLRVRPARTPGVEIGHTLTKRSAKRGRIREFSARSRLGLQLLAADLQSVVKKPDLMVTLTYPAEWRSVTTDFTCHCEAAEGCSDVPCICDFSPSGKVAKRHLDVFQKRITRYLKTLGVSGWGCLWFLEFQKRGAPHFHLLFFGFGFRLFNLSDFQKWLSSAWADIVSHADPAEFQKHLNAGTKAEWCRKEHFGYALKYAAKLEQKSVPSEFADIGRFWGCWNSPLGAPVVRSLYTSCNTLRTIADGLYDRLLKHSSSFAVKLWDALHFSHEASVFTFTVFGSESSEYLHSYGRSPG